MFKKKKEGKAPFPECLNNISSPIQTIYLELPDYEFFHSPSGFQKDDNTFIGRKGLRERLKHLITDGATRSGAYLVTGFRGMGKTSLVRKVLRDSKKKNTNITHIEMSLAQDDIRDLDVLRNLTEKLLFTFKRCLDQSFLGMLWKFRAFFPFFWSIVFLAFYGKATGSLSDEFNSSKEETLAYRYFTTMQSIVEFTVDEKKNDQNDSVSKTKSNILDTFLIGPIALVISVISCTLIYLFIYWGKVRESGITFIQEGKRRWIPKTFWWIFFGALFSSCGLFFIILFKSISFGILESVSQIDGLKWLSGNWTKQILEGIVFSSLCILSLEVIRLIYNRTGLMSPFTILSYLERLVAGIRAEIILDQGGKLNFGAGTGALTISRNRRKVVPIASAKEIEYGLIEFLRQLGYLATKSFWCLLWYAPKFVIVFDELDKIEPNFSQSIDNKGFESPSLGAESGSIFGTDSMRKRQEALAKLLSNMKHFLNVAQAKFIFLAGREMFDAALADISDRESFFGSIFHDVIYVDSFYKDQINSPSYGITTMTEAYLVNRLLTANQITRCERETKDTVSLKMYYRVLENYDKQNGDNLTHLQLDWDRMRREKIHLTLRNLSIFLAYRSNGTPKRLTSLLESFLVVIDQDGFERSKKGRPAIWQFHNGLKSWETTSTLIRANMKPFKKVRLMWNMITRPKPRSRVFLRINYKDQHLIGLTSYLFRPYLLTHSRFLRSFGDKLLVSNTYLIDHLFKFHKHSFSWRNLEVTPEVITFNKSPELREFIRDLISFLVHRQVRETHYGLFQYKFQKDIAEEIMYLSKTSETESAAYNFTLDESILIKRHYNRKLSELETDSISSSIRSEHSHSSGFINSILGDLHYFDREFDDALIHYFNSIQAIRTREMKDLNFIQFFIYVRDKLKIGLTLDKMSAYDSATVHFIDLSVDMIDFFKKKTESDKESSNKKYSKVSPMINHLPLIVLPFIAELSSIEKSTIGGINDSDVKRNFQKFQFLLNLVDNVHKKQLNLLKSIYCSYLGNILFLKNGDIFPKHELVKRIKEGFSFEPDKSNVPISAFASYILAIQQFLGKSNFPKLINNETVPHEVSAILENLLHLLDSSSGTELSRNLTKSELDHLASLLSKLGDCSLLVKESVMSNNCAGLNYDITLIELLLKELDETHKPDASSSFKKDFARLTNECNTLPGVNLALIFYFFSCSFFKMGGQHHSFALQLGKVLHLIRLRLSPSFSKGENRSTKVEIFFHEQCELLVLKPILQNVHWAHQDTGRPQVLKQEYSFGYKAFNTKPEHSRTLYRATSLDPDNRLWIILFSDIKLWTSQSLSNCKEYFSLLMPMSTPFSPISNKFLRSFELEFKVRYNHRLLRESGMLNVLQIANIFRRIKSPSDLSISDDQQLVDQELSKILRNDLDMPETFDNNHVRQWFGEKYEKSQRNNLFDVLIEEDQRTPKKLPKKLNLFLKDLHDDRIATRLENLTWSELTSFLITDSLFALMEILSILSIYETSYRNTHGRQAIIRKYCGDWSTWLHDFQEAFYKKDPDHKDIDPMNLRKYLGNNTLHHLDPKYHYEKAIAHLNKCKEMHLQGSVYNDQIRALNILEDDFSDDLYHFGAAMERLHINSGNVDNLIKELKGKLKVSRFYEYKSFVNTTMGHS